MRNNTRPTLRGTSTCFRGSPGGWKVQTTPPPLRLAYPHRHLFALAWADARVTGDAEEKAVTFRLGAKALDCIHKVGSDKRSHWFYTNGWLARQAFDYIHPAQFISVRKSVSPSRGAGGLEQGFAEGFGQGLEHWFAGVCVACVFTYHFGMLVVRCVWNPFFVLLANQGAYFISLLNIFHCVAMQRCRRHTRY